MSPRPSTRGLATLVSLALTGCLGEVVLDGPGARMAVADATPSLDDAPRSDAAPVADAGLDHQDAEPGDLDAEPGDLGASDAGADGALSYVFEGTGATTATCSGALTPLGLDDTFTARATVTILPGYGTWWPGDAERLPELTGSFVMDNFARASLPYSAADTSTPDRLVSGVDVADHITLPSELTLLSGALIVDRPRITPAALPIWLRYLVESAPSTPFGRCTVDVQLVTRAYP